MATQAYDSYSLFQAQSLEWDAPFTGEKSCSFQQSSEDSETQQSHRNTSPQHFNPDEQSPDPTAMRRMEGTPNSLGKKQILKRRSKVRQLYRVKNERTLLQTGELLQQMEYLEKSLKQTKFDNHSPGVTNKKKKASAYGDSSKHAIEKQPCHKKLVQQMEELEESLKSKSNNRHSSAVTNKKTKENEHADESTEGSSSKYVLRNQPCHKQLGYSRNQLIQKLEYMEQQFLTTEGMMQQQKEGAHADDSSEGSGSKYGIRKHPCHKHLEYSKEQLIQKLEEMETQFLTEGTQQRSATQQPKSYSNDRASLEQWKQSVKERAKQIAVASSSRPSQTTTAKPITTMPPTTEQSPRRPTMVTHKPEHQQKNTVPNRVTRTSLESYITATPLHPFPRRSSKFVVMNSPLRSTTAPKTNSVQSRPVPQLKAMKLQEIINRQQEEREQQTTKQRQDDDNRDQIVQSLGQTRSSIQHLQNLQEKTEPKLASHPTSFRRRLDPTLQQQHQHPKLFAKQQGLRTIRDARQKRLQLLQQRQQDAQRAYLMQQQKRMNDMAKLSSGPSPINTTIKS